MRQTDRYSWQQAVLAVLLSFVMVLSVPAFGGMVSATDRLAQDTSGTHVETTEQLGDIGQSAHRTVALDNTTLSITNVDGQAGGADSPRPIKVEVELLTNQKPYPDGQVTDENFTITVGTEIAQRDVQVVSRDRRPGRFSLRFVPPAQPDPGTYDIDVRFDGAAKDERQGAVTYGTAGTSQLSAALQIDRSGSMDGVMNEAKEGASAFVEQAFDEDYAAIVSYSSNSRVDQGLVRLTDGRQQVNNAIDGISSGGFTNGGAAMVDGLDELKQAPNGTIQAGIHMSDGNINSGPSKGQILNSIVPDYNAEGACLYTIGFTDGADEQFLQDVADASDCGTYHFAGKSGEVSDIRNTLQAVFREVKGQAAGDDTIDRDGGTIGPGQRRNGTVRVDPTVNRMTGNLRLAGLDVSTNSVSPDEARIQTSGVGIDAVDEITFTRPDGTEASDSDPGVNVSVVGDSVIYRVQDPQTGTWNYQIENTQTDPANYTVDVTGSTQTALDFSTAGDTYFAGDDVDLTATLTGPNGSVTDATIEVAITHPNGSNSTVQLDESTPGLYTMDTGVDEPGTYEATATAEKGSISRVEDVSWTVEPTPPLSATQEELPVVLQDTTGTIDLTLSLNSSVSTSEDVTLGMTDLQQVGGNATISRFDLDINPQSVTVSDTANETVVVSATVSADTPPGLYEGTVRLFREDGSIVTEQFPMMVGPAGDTSQSERVTASVPLINDANTNATTQATIELRDATGDTLENETISEDAEPGITPVGVNVTLGTDLDAGGQNGVTHELVLVSNASETLIGQFDLYELGDVDRNGTVSPLDAANTLRVSQGLDAVGGQFNPVAGTVSGTEPSPFNAAQVLRLSQGLEPTVDDWEVNTTLTPTD